MPFSSFVLNGIAWPASMVAIGTTMVLFPQRDRPVPPEELERTHPIIRFLAKRASRSSEIRLGWFMLACGIFIAALRLLR